MTLVLDVIIFNVPNRLFFKMTCNNFYSKINNEVVHEIINNRGEWAIRL